MLDDRERPPRHRADGLGRTVGRGQFGKCGLQLFQFGEKLVVLGVRNLGRVERVVEVVMTQNLGAQQLNAVARGDALGVAD